nr:MAG TPA: hypothetical protein [Caudoviricetes sp.]
MSILLSTKGVKCSLDKGHNAMIKLTKREQQIKKMMEAMFGHHINDEKLAEVIRDYDKKYGIKDEDEAK